VFTMISLSLDKKYSFDLDGDGKTLLHVYAKSIEEARGKLFDTYKVLHTNVAMVGGF